MLSRSKSYSLIDYDNVILILNQLSRKTLIKQIKNFWVFFIHLFLDVLNIRVVLYRLSPSHSFSIHLSVSLYLSIYLFILLYLCLSLSLSIYLALYLFLSLTFPLSKSLALSIFFSLFFSLCLSISNFTQKVTLYYWPKYLYLLVLWC